MNKANHLEGLIKMKLFTLGVIMLIDEIQKKNQEVNVMDQLLTKQVFLFFYFCLSSTFGVTRCIQMHPELNNTRRVSIM